MNMILVTCSEERRSDVKTVIGVFSNKAKAGKAMADDIESITRMKPDATECLNGWSDGGYRWSATAIVLDERKTLQI